MHHPYRKLGAGRHGHEGDDVTSISVDSGLKPALKGTYSVGIFDFFRRPKEQASTRPPASGTTTQEILRMRADAPRQSETLPGERRRKFRVNARQGTRILVIDDSPTIVMALRRMLEQNKLAVLEAGTAEQGLHIAVNEVPDLIFLDIVLPGMNGFTALRTLRREERTKKVPIIMMSGNEQATEEFYVQRIGADDFMKKPFARAEVFARIERMLDADLVPRRNPFLTPPVLPSLEGDTVNAAV
jgi:twitching motility two-component system response regulator PilH